MQPVELYLTLQHQDLRGIHRDAKDTVVEIGHCLVFLLNSVLVDLHFLFCWWRSLDIKLATNNMNTIELLDYDLDCYLMQRGRITTYVTAQCHNPEYHSLNFYCCENLHLTANFWMKCKTESNDCYSSAVLFKYWKLVRIFLVPIC
jgi:hypothetical protein